MKITSNSIHPRLKPLFELSELLFTAAEVAAKTAVKQIRNPTNSRKRASDAYKARHPGVDTPLWNFYASQIARELRQHGSKVRLARYLGIPRQEIHAIFKSRIRLPDAEITLRLLHWFIEKRKGHDLSI